MFQRATIAVLSLVLLFPLLSVAAAGMGSAGSAEATLADSSASQDKPQRKRVGQYKSMGAIYRAWGEVRNPKIYFEDAAHACCSTGVIADICPGDGLHVEVRYQIQVNNLEDDTGLLASTAGNNCGYSSGYNAGDWNHSSPFFEIQAARIKLCRTTYQEPLSCTGFTAYVSNPFV